MLGAALCSIVGPAQSIVVDVGADFADNFSYLVPLCWRPRGLPIKIKCISLDNLRAPPRGTNGPTEGTAERGVPARLRGQGGWGTRASGEKQR